MVVEFSLSNYRSFNTVQTLSFRATGSEKSDLDVTNIVNTEDGRLLKTIGIYGPNGSGKSNLLKGLEVMRRIVTASLDSESPKRYLDPFLLQRNKDSEAGFFQLVILLNEKKYRYGFTLAQSGDISSEWLYGPADKNDTYYFKRKDKNVSINKERFEEGDGIPLEKLRSDALFLSFCSSYDGDISKTIRSYISRRITMDKPLIRRSGVFGMSSAYQITNNLIERGSKDTVLKWLQEVGLNYLDVTLSEGDERGFKEVVFIKNKYDSDGNISGFVSLPMLAQESEGTKKYYNYIGRIQSKFERGGLFSSDEIDANFHPTLLKKLVSLFNNPQVNKAGAQLLFTSHDTNLMDPAIMRRDQFYFTEKNILEETHLYSLADLKGIRNNADFSRQYLSGYYGALPLLRNLLENDNNTFQL